MGKATSVAVRACVWGASGFLLAAGPLLAEVEGNGSVGVVAVPTLGGVGIAALAGALSIGGAWLLSRRDKEK